MTTFGLFLCLTSSAGVQTSVPVATLSAQKTSDEIEELRLKTSHLVKNA